jgi:hypothetical protein
VNRSRTRYTPSDSFGWTCHTFSFALLSSKIILSSVLFHRLTLSLWLEAVLSGPVLSTDP